MKNLNESFEFVYNMTYQKALSYVISRCVNFSDAEDILQEIYSELYQVLRKKGFDYVENYQAFVINIAKFKLFRYYKSRKYEEPFTLINDDSEEYSLYDISDIDIEKQYESKELVTKIREHLSTKPMEIQKIFALFYFADAKIKEIANLMNLTESKVKHKLYGTLKELRKLYSHQN